MNELWISNSVNEWVRNQNSWKNTILNEEAIVWKNKYPIMNGDINRQINSWMDE